MLDHHKRKKNIISNRKAFSSIVGAIFAILVIVSLAGTFFVWSLQQNSRYVSAVSEINQLARDRESESLNVTDNPAYSVGPSTASSTPVTVVVDVQNDGPIYVNLTALWVSEMNSESFGFVPLNLRVLPGITQPIAETVYINAPGSAGPYYAWLITARGNVVPLYPAHAKGDAGAAGSIGPEGPAGETGAPGANGATWFVEDHPPTIEGVNGDFYLNTATGEVYQKTNGSWGTPIGNLKGPAGINGVNGSNGTNGTNGSTWYAGPGVPDANLGVNGDFYFSNNTYCIYNKNSTWALLANLTLLGTGGTGGNGTAWYVGTTLPPNTLGVDGDFYLNTVTYDVFRKSDGTWSFLVNIKGAKGDAAQDATSSLVAQGIGSIMLDFKNVTAYNLVGPYNTTLSAGVSGYNVYMGTTQSKRCVGFSVNLTNLNPDGGTIYLNSSSVFFSLMPYVKTPSQPVEAASWYIVNVNPATRVISSTYTRIILPYNISTRVYFAAYNDLSSSLYLPSDMGTMQPPTTCPINLALIGNIVLPDGTVEPFGQNLPFVSIYVRGTP